MNSNFSKNQCDPSCDFQQWFLEQCSTWPVEEARTLVKRLERRADGKNSVTPVIFETGYGPSGLPHIGTFGEVFRTTMVQWAFQQMSHQPTRLIAFSDDMDGLRKIPDNIPNKDMVSQHIGKPLTSIPDPFGQYPSFAHHNNAMLRQFLDSFGFAYEFMSATECYQSGMFDQTLLGVLEHHQSILDVMLPSLGQERQSTYSPFLPICPKTGKVLQVPVLEYRINHGTIVFLDESGQKVELPVTKGHCKLQWKVDWAMRWTALCVDYEMAGKDLIDSVKLSSRLCKILGGTPPEGFSYELFLDDKGEKISKSKGNGISMEEWLRYAPKESLSLFMFQNPKRAKRLFFDVIPKAVDEYYQYLSNLSQQSIQEQATNPVWYIHQGQAPTMELPISFSLLLNLVSVCHAESKDVVWGFIEQYTPNLNIQQRRALDHLVGYALQYYVDFIKPSKQYRLPNDTESAAITALIAALEQLPENADAEIIQNSIYHIGKQYPFESLRHWFKALYEILLGQSEGPRLGSFFALYGLDKSLELMKKSVDSKSGLL